MSLTTLYTAYLRSRDDQARQNALSAALSRAGYTLEARLLAQASDAKHRDAKQPIVLQDSSSAWDGRRAWLGDVPPPTSVVRGGDIWLDTCELTASVLLARRDEDFAELPLDWQERMTPFAGWLALRPAARWQFQTFLETASTQSFPVQLEPPFPLLNPQRILPPSTTESAPATLLTAGEARMYALFWGKSLADLEVWELAKEQLSPDEFNALWGTHDNVWSEWVAYSGADESVHIAITRDTIDCDPEETEEMQRSEWAYQPQLGLRTATSMQTGLIRFGPGEVSGPLPGSGENVHLASQAPRQ